jgi:L-asparagine transporter-like permease
MVLELSQALALVRPQAPAWSFTPVPTSVRRVLDLHTVSSYLEVEFAVAFVKRRTPGVTA